MVVLGIVGSPRKAGRSNALVEAALSGAVAFTNHKSHRPSATLIQELKED